MTRSRRAGLSRDEVRQQPLYARMLGLQYLAPGGFLCFVFLEGAVALGMLLALAELVSWWGVLVLPAMVAIMVKLNDVVAGMLMRPGVNVRTAPGALPEAETVRLSPAVIAEVSNPPGDGRPALRPATVPHSPPGSAGWMPPGSAGPAGSVPRNPAGSTPRVAAEHGASMAEHHAASVMDASALNGPPVTRHWTDDLDDREQRARQSAARRYE